MRRPIEPSELHRFAGGHGVALASRVLWARRRRHDPSHRLAEALCGPGDVVVDAGANWGLYTAALARMVGPSGRVHAIDPNPTSTASLRALAAARRCVRVHETALSEREGSAELRVPVAAGRPVHALGRVSEPPAGWGPDRRLPVTVRRLDEVLGSDRDSVAFIKCDVEGHELELFRGAAQTLAARPGLLVEIEQRHTTRPIDAVFGHLTELGYQGFAVTPAGVLPLREFDLERDQLAFLRSQPPDGAMPPGYVHDFLFVVEDTAAALPLIAKRGRAPRPPA